MGGWLPSSNLFLLIVPLILLTGIISLLSPNSSRILKASSRSSSANEDKPEDMHSEEVLQESDGMQEALLNEAAVNPSASPSVSAEASQVQQSNVPNSSISGTSNSTSDLPSNQSREKAHTKLERLEAGLHRARAAIKAAGNQSQLQDPDYVPNGPIYLNPKAFHRSYLEMEKRFKVYVYREGEPPLFHDGPCGNLYAIEGIFINKMEINNQFQTHDPERAHVFYLPYSVTRMVQHVWVPGTRVDSIGKTIADYVNVIARKYTYFNRSLGADHFMLSCHDWGPITSKYSPYLVKNSIRALCNANTSEQFNPVKDVTVPEISLGRTKGDGEIGGPSPSQRSILAFFAGGINGYVRQLLFKHWENKDPDIRVHTYLPKGLMYIELMRQSKFCLCPSGYEVASPRIVEALYNGCVPVLISKSFVPPFSDVLNWKKFSVEVPLEEIPNLKKILMGISERQYLRMQRRVLQVRRHFQLNAPPQRFDVFPMILHSVWLRRLNIRVTN